MQRSLIAFAIPALVLGLLGSASLYTVQQGHQAIVLQLGRLVKIEKEPGLKFKIPFVQEVITYDKRILDFDMNEFPAILGDQKRLLVSIFGRYRIVSPEKFYKTVRNEMGARDRLRPLTESFVLSVLGKYTLADLLSERRDDISDQMLTQLNTATEEFGIELIDLRLRRTDLPTENSEAIFNRMISERQQEAQEFRSEGEELSREIKAQADREKTVILANARKESQITRGAGDAQAIELAVRAYGQDQEFYQFYRSMEAYKSALKSEDTTYLMSPNNDFFKHFNKF